MVPIEVQTGTCFPKGDKSSDVARRRLRRVMVRETRQAVFIGVLMRPERRPPGGFCKGVGILFVHYVRLRSPVGGRAVIDTEHHYDPSEPVIYRALDPRTNAALAQHYHRKPLKPQYESSG